MLGRGADRRLAADRRRAARRRPCQGRRQPARQVVGVHERAGYPRYRLAADGYPEATDVDHRLLVGCGANADRYEDWRSNPTPPRDGQQPLARQEPLKWYPANAAERDDAFGDDLVTGQVPGETAVHTATEIPLSAYGPGALAFTGVMTTPMSSSSWRRQR